MPRRIALACTFLLLGCTAGESPSTDATRPRGQPAGWDDALRIAEPIDLDPDPHVLEIELEAKIAPVEIAPGRVIDAWTYNGQLPGPLIRAKAGDKLVVRFKNSLPSATTVHWHGIRLPVAMDGVPEHSQPQVEPGGSFRYEFVLPDAGTFWYHPHVRSNEQTSDGLYGPIVVEDPNEPAGKFGDELVLVMSDLALTDHDALDIHTRGGDIATLFGREGEIVLVNGKINPTLLVRKGARQRWRVIDAAQSRYFWLQLDGHTWTRIGGDGGLLPAPVETDRLLLASAERADVAVLPNGDPGSTAPVKWVAFDRGYGTAFMRPDESILTLRYADDEVAPTELPATGRTIAPIDLAGATPISVKLTRNDVNGNLALGINGLASKTMLDGRVGERQVWTIENTIDWAHPFHLHGFFFQVLDEHGQPIPEWKDTANVPQNGKLSIAVKYDDRPGDWMFHCHILDHAEAGMMGMLMLR